MLTGPCRLLLFLLFPLTGASSMQMRYRASLSVLAVVFFLLPPSARDRQLAHMDIVITDVPLAPLWRHRDLSELEAGIGVLWSLGQHSNTQARSSLVAAMLCGSAALLVCSASLPL